MQARASLSPPSETAKRNRVAAHPCLQVQIKPVSRLVTEVFFCARVDYLCGNCVVGKKRAEIFEVLVEIGMNA